MVEQAPAVELHLPTMPRPLPQGPGTPPGMAPQAPQGPRLGLSAVQVPGGLRAVSVIAGSAAEAAGVKVGDVVTAANGQATPTIEVLQGVVQTAGPGGTVTLAITRGAATQTLTARLGPGV